MNRNLTVFCLGLALLTTGCVVEENVFRNRARDYKKIEHAPKRIRVPAEMAPETFSEEYQIPGE
jgi:uncharacterized lipoprotein